MPLISVDATQVNERDGSILNLGQKSLVAIELRNWITREFEAPLQSSEIMTDQWTSLYQRIQEVGPEVIADAYERQMYLERREPLPENGPFTFIHPINAPQRSQAWRAAIAPDTLHGETLTSEGRNWLFYATRLPGISVDSMKHYSPNHTVAVLWRRHVFELKSQSADQPINAQEVYAAYREIRKTTEELRELKRDC
ncbi:hypothetical protein SS1G_12987 [Sclerotinia sclerotiorum 1980 UF-70]|uniref:Uncharacterized protein n=1 Tax=Sclerotinia sclerotiorum (strain ATCC 18683 / 1980 / Ss-1) TaxID=665079 RepID=A7F5V9_SCLS1|nr:hypothetical protein SS1G_12987 [Sclerotinia sclerotiorum 1980 UF-70]EDN98130.1 hypothetical protein SS1G_12987 [Sclerotinia sclerotiorum 1980 UF-70]